MPDEDKQQFCTSHDGNGDFRIGIINPSLEEMRNGSTACVMTLGPVGVLSLIKDLTDMLADYQGIPSFKEVEENGNDT